MLFTPRSWSHHRFLDMLFVFRTMHEWFAGEATLVTEIGPTVVIGTSIFLLFYLSLITKAPYGRYQDTKYGFVVPARVRLR